MSANRVPWYKNSCVTGALEQGALSAGVDAIGLIPEAGGISRVIGHQAGYVGIVADRYGAKVLGAVRTGGGIGQVGLGLSDASPQGLLSTGLAILSFVPAFGQGIALAQIGFDAIKTGIAVARCE